MTTFLAEDNIVTYIDNKAIDTCDLEWNHHPTFKGVSLKHIVTGSMIDNKLSCHLIRVKAGCEIEEHIHETNCELHQAVKGTGTGIINGEEVFYAPGVSSVIPQGTAHKVVAGDEDLYFIARFVPALM